MHRTSLLILGAGPTGLGAAWQLRQLGTRRLGIDRGKPSSWRTSEFIHGCQGLHLGRRGTCPVLTLSVFRRGDARVPGHGWLAASRARILGLDPRPFCALSLPEQHSSLPKADLDQCLQGLVEITRSPQVKASNFREWIYEHFGGGIAEVFLLPL